MRRNIMKRSAVVLLLLLVGCSHVTVRPPPGLTRRQFAADKMECDRYSRTQCDTYSSRIGDTVIGGCRASSYREIFLTCLESKGYQVDTND